MKHKTQGTELTQAEFESAQSHLGESGQTQFEGSVTIDPPSIAGGATADVDVTVSGLTTSHKVTIQCQGALEHGLVCIAASVPAADTLRVRISNLTGVAIDGAALTWAYIAF